MARGLDEFRARKDALSYLGKDLARRAKRKCELCEQGGQRLDPYEVAPLPEEPRLDQAVMLCERCAETIYNDKRRSLGDLNQWRFLDGVVWSEIAPVQVTAIRLLRLVAEAGAGWAGALDETLYVSDEIAAWIDGAAPDEGIFG